jgi:hypothetical protein
LPDIVGAINDINLGSRRLCSFLVHADADQLAVVDALEAMAGGAHVFIHDVPAADRSRVVSGENARVTPRHVLEVCFV